jgi:hypothetical protein
MPYPVPSFLNVTAQNYNVFTDLQSNHSIHCDSTMFSLHTKRLQKTSTKTITGCGGLHNKISKGIEHSLCTMLKRVS